jgi:hypothetical protein
MALKTQTTSSVAVSYTVTTYYANSNGNNAVDTGAGTPLTVAVKSD